MDSNTLAIVAALLGGGGIVGTISAMIKAKQEANRIVIDAAQGAVVVQSGVITSLREEIARMSAAHAHCEKRLEKLEAAFKAIDERKRSDPGSEQISRSEA